MKNFWSLLAAYGLGWAIFFGYLLTLLKRLGRLEEKLRRLQAARQVSRPES
jgi:cytochrome c biogenesis protein CcdA